MESLDFTHLAAAGMILFAGGVAAFFFIRALAVFKTSAPRRDTPPEKMEKTEFVIDAFGRVVQQLKEKEQELQKLRTVAERRATDAEQHNKVLLEQMEMKKRLSLLGEMSAGIAHEFRNSLGTILGYARLASKRLPDDDPGLQYLSAIADEIGDLNTIIQDLLSYGKPLTLRSSRTDISELLRKTAQNTLRNGRDSITVRYDLPAHRILLMIDEVLMRQVLVNLIQNAMDAMPEGGRITLNVRPYDASEEWIEIRVSDTGGGISEEHLEKIFLPFFTTKAKGTGMGLALAHKIVLAHGGQIRVERAEDRGTTFIILLPCDKFSGKAAGEDKHSPGMETREHPLTLPGPPQGGEG